jgi:uncharacterized protein DUF3562
MSPPQQTALAPLHVYAIDALVQETKRPLAEVANLYVNELTRLQMGARVQDYLVLLTCKRVRDGLRRGEPPRFPEPSASNPLPEEEVR